MEIERKFLVTSDAWRRDAKGSAEIEQGYIAKRAAASVRVRIENGTAGFLTIKSREPGRSRSEFEYEISIEDARALMALCGEDKLTKRRYRVPQGKLTWEIDVFAGPQSGLIMAEIELPTANEPLTLPGWIGDEVTDDPRNRNANLVGGGKPSR